MFIKRIYIKDKFFSSLPIILTPEDADVILVYAKNSFGKTNISVTQGALNHAAELRFPLYIYKHPLIDYKDLLSDEPWTVEVTYSFGKGNNDIKVKLSTEDIKRYYSELKETNFSFYKEAAYSNLRRYGHAMWSQMLSNPLIILLTATSVIKSLDEGEISQLFTWLEMLHFIIEGSSGEVFPSLRSDFESVFGIALSATNPFDDFMQMRSIWDKYRRNALYMLPKFPLEIKKWAKENYFLRYESKDNSKSKYLPTETLWEQMLSYFSTYAYLNSNAWGELISDHFTKYTQERQNNKKEEKNYETHSKHSFEKYLQTLTKGHPEELPSFWASILINVFLLTLYGYELYDTKKSSKNESEEGPETIKILEETLNLINDLSNRVFIGNRNFLQIIKNAILLYNTDNTLLNLLSLSLILDPKASEAIDCILLEEYRTNSPSFKLLFLNGSETWMLKAKLNKFFKIPVHQNLRFGFIKNILFLTENLVENILNLRAPIPETLKGNRDIEYTTRDILTTLISQQIKKHAPKQQKLTETANILFNIFNVKEIIQSMLVFKLMSNFYLEPPDCYIQVIRNLFNQEKGNLPHNQKSDELWVKTIEQIELPSEIKKSVINTINWLKESLEHVYRGETISLNAESIWKLYNLIEDSYRDSALLNKSKIEKILAEGIVKVTTKEKREISLPSALIPSYNLLEALLNYFKYPENRKDFEQKILQPFIKYLEPFKKLVISKKILQGIYSFDSPKKGGIKALESIELIEKISSITSIPTYDNENLSRDETMLYILKLGLFFFSAMIIRMAAEFSLGGRLFAANAFASLFSHLSSKVPSIYKRFKEKFPEFKLLLNESIRSTSSFPWKFSPEGFDLITGSKEGESMIEGDQIGENETRMESRRDRDTEIIQWPSYHFRLVYKEFNIDRLLNSAQVNSIRVALYEVFNTFDMIFSSETYKNLTNAKNLPNILTTRPWEYIMDDIFTSMDEYNRNRTLYNLLGWYEIMRKSGPFHNIGPRLWIFLFEREVVEDIFSAFVITKVFSKEIHEKLKQEGALKVEFFTLDALDPRDMIWDSESREGNIKLMPILNGQGYIGRSPTLEEMKFMLGIPVLPNNFTNQPKQRR